MKLTFEDERVLAVVAHPDDAELLCAGTLARAKADGVAIGMCVLCQGEKGQPSKKVADLGAVRRKEAAASARLLGAQIFFGEEPDGTLTDSVRTRRKLVEVYRKFKPTLVLAHAPEDYHPDHRAASALAEAASWFCASRGHRTRRPAMESPPALWWMDTVTMAGFTPAFYVDIGGHEGLKAQMLMCHKSQLLRDKDADVSPLTRLMQAQIRARGMQAGVESAEAYRAYGAFKRARAW